MVNLLKLRYNSEMELVEIRAALGWCTIINSSFLLFWAAFFVFGRSFIHRVHGGMFEISAPTTNAIHYSGMAFFKILIFVFNLVPYLALRIIG